MLAGYLLNGSDIPIGPSDLLPAASISGAHADTVLADPVQMVTVYLHR